MKNKEMWVITAVNFCSFSKELDVLILSNWMRIMLLKYSIIIKTLSQPYNHLAISYLKFFKSGDAQMDLEEQFSTWSINGTEYSHGSDNL